MFLLIQLFIYFTRSCENNTEGVHVIILQLLSVMASYTVHYPNQDIGIGKWELTRPSHQILPVTKTQDEIDNLNSLVNIRKINILFDHREPKQKIKTSSRPHMVTRPGATYKKFEDGWPSHLADRHYWLAIFLLQLTNSSNGMTPSINLFFLTDK